MKKIFQALVELVIALTPKFHWCVLRGFPDYDDNCLAIYEKLADYGCAKVIWVVADPESPRPFITRAGTLVVKRGSLRDYFYSTLAKYLFITHGHFIENIPGNQVSVNLWHGIPYKAIGKLDGKPGRRDTLVVATSELTREVFARVFGVGTDRVVATGQARTDRMFVDRAAVRAQLGLTDPSTRIFLWLPTFRRTTMGQERLDGRDSGNVFNCANFPANEFDAFLRENNSVCLVKAHPMASSVATSSRTENLWHINDQWLRSRNLTLYQVAGAADFLVSDISSIVVDFLLLDRPVVLLFEDIVEYREARGFVFSPVEEWLPARVNTDYLGFMDDVCAVLAGEDRYVAARARLKKAFFSHDDGHSSTRILDRAFNRGNAPRPNW